MDAGSVASSLFNEGIEGESTGEEEQTPSDRTPASLTTEVLSEEGEEEEVAEVYNSEDFISTSFRSEGCDVPEDILEFIHSFGYDCKRYYNLAAPDEHTLVFASGNIIHFLDVETLKLTFRRSAFGTGIGHIAVNPNPELSHIAVAENGNEPPIIIYEWPSLEIVSILMEGAAKRYRFVNYSPDGELLVSQSGEPDHLITVWDWLKAKIILRTKSHNDDVYNVQFSASMPNQLTSSGAGHLKFWRMAKTFTGLKLLGDLGRFGKTEICDVLGLYPMPDEKVVSGSAWGNILIWEAGLIKFEVMRKLRTNCHDGPIVQFEFRDENLWSVGMDGRVRVWFYKTIDIADPPDDDRVVLLEPVYDFYTPDAQFMCMIKQRPMDPEHSLHYVQDGNGKIQLIDLNTEDETEPPQVLLYTHGGAVVDMVTCPWGPYFVSLGESGHMHVYQYLEKRLVHVHQFPAKGRVLLWVPPTIDPSGSTIIAGFDDGVLRVTLTIITNDSCSVNIVQVVKPHSQPITALSMNRKCSILVTGGEDATIFVFQITIAKAHILLRPLGFISMPSSVTCMDWKPFKTNILMVGCFYGEFLQVRVPETEGNSKKISYELFVETTKQQFTTCKAQIRREIKIKEIQKQKDLKVEKKKKELNRLRAENPGLDIDEEAYLADSQSDEELEPLHIPEIPNKILFLKYVSDTSIWLSMAQYDSGYIYEYDIGQTDPTPKRSTMLPEADDIEIVSYLHNFNKKYIFFGLKNGKIRVTHYNADNPSHLTHYWEISMHDNFNGCINRMCFAYDELYLFSCGSDGNIFMNHYRPERNSYVRPPKFQPQLPSKVISTTVVAGYETLSLEETKAKEDYDYRMMVANEKKEELRNELSNYKAEYEEVKSRNSKLYPSQAFLPEDLMVDERVTRAIESIFEDQLALVKRKLAFDVEQAEVAVKKLKAHFTDPLDVMVFDVKAIKSNNKVSTVRQRKLPPEFHETMEIVKKKDLEEQMRGRRSIQIEKRILEKPQGKKEELVAPRKPRSLVEPFLHGLSSDIIKHGLGAKLTRLLEKYRMQKAKRERRQEQWDEHNSKRPLPGVFHPEDVRAFEEAKRTIGDYKLKSDSDYLLPLDMRETTVRKFGQLLDAKLEENNLKHTFNMKVRDLRDKRVQLYKNAEANIERIQTLQKSMPSELVVACPSVPPAHEDTMFPEKMLEGDVKKSPSIDDNSTIDIQEIMFRTDTLKLFTTDISKMKIPASIKLEYLQTLCVDGSPRTPWETELSLFRLAKKCNERDRLIKQIDTDVHKFDEEVETLRQERIHLLVHATFLGLHVLTLNQELIVLQEFESVENSLEQNVQDIKDEYNDKINQVEALQIKLDFHKREVEVHQEAEKDIQVQFATLVQDQKFADFLFNIFRKKYRAPKTKTTDDSSSSSSSYESSEEYDEDEDIMSLDSKDIGSVKLDESVCPKGCDKELYDLTFSLRSKRHETEFKLKDELRNIEVTQKEIEVLQKKIRQDSDTHLMKKEELENYQRQKQKKLNQVLCIVILHLNQMQHILPDFKLNKISNVLLFSCPTLQHLNSRVGHLQTEMLRQKARHKRNKTHFQRMRLDCKYMEKEISELRYTINEVMRKKFGRPIDLTELEEAILRRLVHALRISMIDVSKAYEKDVAFWKEEHVRKQRELIDIIKDNTVRLELLALLNQEHTELAKLLAYQTDRIVHVETASTAEDLKADVGKLMSIVKDQKRQIEQLKVEIKILSSKGLAVPQKPPITSSSHQDKAEEMEETESFEDILAYDYNMETYRYYGLPDTVMEMIHTLANEMLLKIKEIIPYRGLVQVKNLLVEAVATNRTQEEIAYALRHAFDSLEMQVPQELIDETAAEAFSISQSEEKEADLIKCAREIIDEIITNAMSSIVSKDELVRKILDDLVNNLPIEFLLVEENKDHLKSIFEDKIGVSSSLVSGLVDSAADTANYILELLIDQIFNKDTALPSTSYG